MSSRLPVVFFHHRVSTKDLWVWEKRGTLTGGPACPPGGPQEWTQPQAEGHIKGWGAAGLKCDSPLAPLPSS